MHTNSADNRCRQKQRFSGIVEYCAAFSEDIRQFNILQVSRAILSFHFRCLGLRTNVYIYDTRFVSHTCVMHINDTCEGVICLSCMYSIHSWLASKTAHALCHFAAVFITIIRRLNCSLGSCLSASLYWVFSSVINIGNLTYYASMIYVMIHLLRSTECYLKISCE